MYLKWEEIVIVITQCFSAPVSAIASGTLMVMIQRSDQGLRATSRRILFGLCFYDFLYSFAASFSSLPIPKGQGMWGANGNITTCDIQGFLIQFGFVGSMLYNASLSIYYASVIKFGMSEEEILKKIEPFLHFIANLYPLVTSIYLLHGQYFNSDGHLCWVATIPKECADDPDIKCIRGDEIVYFLRRICFGYVVYTAVCIIVLNMTLIVCKVTAQMSRSNRWRFGNGNGNGGRRPKSKKASNNRSNAEHLPVGTFESHSAPIPHEKPSSSSAHESSSQDTHPFDLKAMRASVKYNMVENRCNNDIAEGAGASVRPRSSASSGNDSILSVLEGGRKMRSSFVSFDIEKGEDPHPFDLKAMRAKAKKGGLLLDKKKKDALPVDPKKQKQPTWERIETNAEEESKKKKSCSGSHSHSHGRDSSSSLRNSKTPCSTRRRSSVVSRRPSSASADDEMKVVMVQALLYIAAFFSSVVFSGACRILESNGVQAPFIIYELSRIFSPLQGLFNILIYTRPHVKSVRNQDPDMSWWRAFWMTIKTGGDNNSAGQGRRGDHRASDRVRERIERNHLLRMEQIRADAERRRRADEERTSLQLSIVSPITATSTTTTRTGRRRLSLNHTTSTRQPQPQLEGSGHKEGDILSLNQNQEDDYINSTVDKKMEGKKEAMFLDMEGKDQLRVEQNDSLKESMFLDVEGKDQLV